MYICMYVSKNINIKEKLLIYHVKYQDNDLIVFVVINFFKHNNICYATPYMPLLIIKTLVQISFVII